MTTVEDIQSRFEAAREAFEIKPGQPTKNYITRIEETAGEILYAIRYDVEKGRTT